MQSVGTPLSRHAGTKKVLFALSLMGLFAIFYLIGTPPQTLSADDGQAPFQQKCAVCHTIGRGVLVGPDLQGVTQRREESWLKVHIQSPSTQRAQNDPIAVANVEKFGMPMPDLGLTEQEVEAIIAYLKTAQVTQATRPDQYFPTLAIGVLAIVGLTLTGLIWGTKRVEVRP